MSRKQTYHKPVLLKESIEALDINPDGIYVDATFGGGSHSMEILKKLKNGTLIAFDQDQDAKQNIPDDKRLIFVNANYRFIKNFLKLYKAIPVDGILADLGVSSHQYDVPERGFSTRYDATIDMRMDKRNPLTGKQVLNNYSENDLNRIFSKYGEVKNSLELARQIIQARKTTPIITTGLLIEIIKNCCRKSNLNKYLAKVFQAIRIEVNNELESLKILLEKSLDVLKTGGRIVVISYHSLEDRLVKNFFKTGNTEGKFEKDFFGNPQLSIKPIGLKPIVPGEEEIIKNNRARSAKLRIAEKI